MTRRVEAGKAGTMSGTIPWRVVARPLAPSGRVRFGGPLARRIYPHGAVKAAVETGFKEPEPKCRPHQKGPDEGWKILRVKVDLKGRGEELRGGVPWACGVRFIGGQAAWRAAR